MFNSSYRAIILFKLSISYLKASAAAGVNTQINKTLNCNKKNDINHFQNETKILCSLIPKRPFIYVAISSRLNNICQY
jgi:hypothetical protein